MACNYDDGAEEEDGSCIYPETGLDCEGNCLEDSDGDGNCDPEVEGCTDELACNYVTDATEDDGSCEYCSCTDDASSGYGLALETLLAHPDTGELAGMTTYRMYITTANDTNDGHRAHLLERKRCPLSSPRRLLFSRALLEQMLAVHPSTPLA